MSTYARNFVIFTLFLALCAGGLAYGFYKGREEIDRGTGWVNHSYALIANAYELSTLVEASLAANRAYMMTGEANFITEYDVNKESIGASLLQLDQLTADNPIQAARVAEARVKFALFAEKLERRTRDVTPGHLTPTALADLETINTLKADIRAVDSAMIKDESELLNARIASLEQKKAEYLTTMLLGGIIAIVFLAMINAFLLRVQERKGSLEKDLDVMKERLSLALRGSRDGIYDWNMETNEVYWSPEYMQMLGYDGAELKAGLDTFESLAHPDDYPAVVQARQMYLDGYLPEFSQIFRMRHKSGGWVWVHSRGRAQFDDNGRPVRFVGAHTDVTSLKEAETVLKREREKAEKANHAKTNFLAHMSHEIRTPLTAISGIAEIFERNNKGLDDKQKKLVATLNNSTRVLREMITDILDFSKIESGELELSESDFRLDTLFEEIAGMMAVKAGEKGIEFTFNYEGLRGAEFHGDQMRLRQIIINLIGNAIKFTDKGGVTVTAAVQPRGNAPFLRIDVTDTGIGVAPENREVIFEQFKQADSSVSRKYGGTGLGLSISRNLARLMKGDILLASEQGHGSTFSLLVPANLTLENGAAAIETAVPTAGRDIAGRKKILMVEDYDGNVVVISYILDELGCAYDVARNGRQGVEKWQAGAYDVVLMDVQMPEMDGFTATRRIRELEKAENRPYTPIIGMTAHALVGDKDKCIAAGMDAYLPKPIVESDLKSTILRFIDSCIVQDDPDKASA